MKIIPLWRKAVYAFFAPLFFLVWMIFHPKLVWIEAKREWNKRGTSCKQDCNQGRACTCKPNETKL